MRQKRFFIYARGFVFILLGYGLLVGFCVGAFYPNVAHTQVITVTPVSSGRVEPSNNPPFTLRIVATIILDDAPVKMGLDNENNGLDALIVATIQRVWLTVHQNRLINMLTQPPYNAVVVEQQTEAPNQVIVEIDESFIAEIRALPYVTNVSVENNLIDPVATYERPERGIPAIGTRVPPIQPPGYNGE